MTALAEAQEGVESVPHLARRDGDMVEMQRVDEIGHSCGLRTDPLAAEDRNQLHSRYHWDRRLVDEISEDPSLRLAQEHRDKRGGIDDDQSK